MHGLIKIASIFFLVALVGCSTNGRVEDVRTQLRLAPFEGRTAQIRVSTPKGWKSYYVNVGDEFGYENEFELVYSGDFPRRRFSKRHDYRRVVVHHKKSNSDFELRRKSWSVFVADTGPEMKNGRSAKLLKRPE